MNTLPLLLFVSFGSIALTASIDYLQYKRKLKRISDAVHHNGILTTAFCRSVQGMPFHSATSKDIITECKALLEDFSTGENATETSPSSLVKYAVTDTFLTGFLEGLQHALRLLEREGKLGVTERTPVSYLATELRHMLIESAISAEQKHRQRFRKLQSNSKSVE